MSEWFEAAEFWGDLKDVLFDAEREGRAAREADGVVDLLSLGPGAKVLDLCCGTGRHAAQLHRLGLRVTGVDRFAPYLEEARAREPAIEWVEADMREFQRDGAFDAAINLWSSFGYFADVADDLRVARRVRASLRRGGAFLVDLKGKEVVAGHFTPRTWHTLEDGSDLLVDLSVHEGWKYIEQRWTVLRGAERRDYSMRLRLYSGAELETLLREAGFAHVDLHGDFEGSEYGPDATRLIAVAR